MSFNYAQAEIVFQEVPDHISLVFSITGCPLRCKGCHSAQTWKASAGIPLTEARLLDYLQQYSGLISCVVFLGGEWQPSVLKAHLITSRAHGLKTCLYTGLDEVATELKDHIDYLKTGRWDPRFGGLSSKTTNQRFIDLRTGRSLLNRFQESVHETA